MLSKAGFLPGQRASVQQSFQRWLRRRVPPQKSITLNQRCIFIFPTKIGFAFAALLILLFLGAINYENSLIQLSLEISPYFCLAIEEKNKERRNKCRKYLQTHRNDI